LPVALQALDGKVAEAVDDKTRLTPHGIAIAAQIREHLKASRKVSGSTGCATPSTQATS
jgi:hypothetical protein